MKPYADYATSGIEWLGEIPTHWEVGRLKFSATARTSSVDKVFKEDETPVALCNYVDVYKNEFITSDLPFMAGSATEDEIERFALQHGDVVLTKDSESWTDIAVPALVAEDLDNVVCGYHLAIVRGHPGKFHPGYLFRLFCSEMVNYQFKIEANGVTRFGLPASAVDCAMLLRPPFEEQVQISEFLDRETARIDALIDRKRRLLTLLEEKRLAAITQAVTKGLDAAASTKDSGVRWLGSIPKHWQVKRVKFTADFITSGSRGWAEYYSDDGALFLQSGNLGSRMELSFNFIQRVTPPPGAEGLRTAVTKGDVLVCITGARTGAVAHVAVDLGEAYINQHVALLRPESKVYPRFLAYSLWSNVGREQLLLSSYGMKEGLGLQHVLAVQISAPPINEQIAIVEYLDHEQAGIDRFHTKVHTAIARLSEYRSALITAAVTGKIDVRDLGQRKEAAE